MVVGHSVQTFSALSHRNYRLFLTGQVISLSGTWMQTVAQAWLVYELTKSAFALGVVGFATRVPIIFLSLFAGVLADRINKRNILLVTQTVAMIQAFVLAILTLTGVVRFWHVAVLGTLLGATQSFDAPTRHSFFKEMVGRKDLMNAIALNSTAFNMARLIGPAIAGVLIYAIGVGGCFLVNAFSFLAVIGAYLLMRLERTPRDVPKASHWDELKEGLQYVKSHVVIRRAVSLIGLASLFTFSYGTLFPVFASQVLQGDAGTYAGLMTAAGAGALVSALVVASLGNFDRKGLLTSAGVVLFPLTIIALTFTGAPLTAMVMCFVLGLAMILLTASMNTLVQSAITDRLRGRVMSFYVLVFLGPLPFGNLLAGHLAETLGVITTLRLGAGISLVVSSILLIRTPEFIKFRAS
ncbi:MAG: MFS transporter [Candidatus Eisenbacteria bacterium]